MRLWSVSKLEQGAGAQEVEHGGQVGGTLFKHTDVGPVAFNLPLPDPFWSFLPRDRAFGSVYSRADGQQYSVLIQAPLLNPFQAHSAKGSISHLDEYQAYEKRAGDASLKITIRRARLARGGGGRRSRRRVRRAGRDPGPAAPRAGAAHRAWAEASWQAAVRGAEGHGALAGAVPAPRQGRGPVGARRGRLHRGRVRPHAARARHPLRRQARPRERPADHAWRHRGLGHGLPAHADHRPLRPWGRGAAARRDPDPRGRGRGAGRDVRGAARACPLRQPRRARSGHRHARRRRPASGAGARARSSRPARAAGADAHPGAAPRRPGPRVRYGRARLDARGRRPRRGGRDPAVGRHRHRGLAHHPERRRLRAHAPRHHRTPRHELRHRRDRLDRPRRRRRRGLRRRRVPRRRHRRGRADRRQRHPRFRLRRRQVHRGRQPDGDVVRTDFFGGGDQANAVAVQPDGKIVVAGFATRLGIDGDFAVVRYLANGKLDDGFGTHGVVTTDLATEADDARAIAIRPDRSIVVAGSAGEDIALARYSSDGKLQGTTVTDLGSDDVANGVALTPDGHILVAGYTLGAHNGRDFLLMRYDADGKQDATFPVVRTDVLGGDDFAENLLVDAQGRIDVVGRATGSTILDMALVRYTPTGSVDRKNTADFHGRGEFGQDLALDAQGRIVADGYTANGNDTEFALMRALP